MRPSLRPVLALAVALALTGGLAVADSANPVIAARQQVMKGIGGSMKVLGDMASGKAAFDAAAARAAAEKLQASAAQIPAAFAQNMTDADSKASPKIWADHAEFLRHAEKLQAGAKAVDPSSLDHLKASLGAAGGECRECHTEFRL